MFKSVFHHGLCNQLCRLSLGLIAACLLLSSLPARTLAQGYQRELPSSGK